MNFLENNSTKIAGILCTATMLPVVGTVMAMETAPGWKADQKYVTEEGVYAKGWQEIDGDSYYFDEEGSLDVATTAKAYTAKAAPAVSDSLKDSIRSTIADMEEAEEETVIEDEIQSFAEEIPAEEEVVIVEEAPVEEEAVIVEEAAPVVLPEISEEAPAEVQQPEVTPEQPEVNVPVEEMPAAPVEEEIPAQPEYTEPAQPEIPAAPEYTEPAQPEYVAPVQPEVPSVPEYTEPAQPEVPSVPEYTEPVQPEAPAPVQPSGGQYDQLNQNIVNAALGLVGVTDGWQCTNVATAALNGAGVAAGVVWPDQYLQYGYATNDPQAGNLIYYNQGGRGQDHIAIYIGNGQAVHGNFDGKTIITSAYLPGASSMTYIQIVN